MHYSKSLLLALCFSVFTAMALSVPRREANLVPRDILPSRIQRNQYNPRNRTISLRANRIGRALVPRASALCGPNKCSIGKVCRDTDGSCIDQCLFSAANQGRLFTRSCHILTHLLIVSRLLPWRLRLPV